MLRRTVLRRHQYSTTIPLWIGLTHIGVLNTPTCRIFFGSDNIVVTHHHQCVRPRAGLLLQTQERRLQFCSKASLPLQTREPRFSFLGMNRCGSFPLLSSPHAHFNISTDFKDLKISQGPQHGGEEWVWLTGPSRLYRKSPQGLHISSIRVLDQIRDPEIPITFSRN